MLKGTSRRGQSGSSIGVLCLLLGGVLDLVVMNPLFQSLTKGTSTVGWDPATTFLFFVVLPYVTSVAMVAAVLGGLAKH